MTKMRTCLKCGWVHFPMTREDAEESVKKFNDYFDTLSQEHKDDYYGGRKSSIESYEYCFRCGNHCSNFRDSVDGDAPDGVTLQPIITDVV